MISQKFSSIPDERLTECIFSDLDYDVNDLYDSIESVSDLWILAKINEIFNEEIKIAYSGDAVAHDYVVGVCGHQAGGSYRPG